MLWTIAVMMDSAERFHDLLVRRLRGREREELWRDYVRFGELFGMPREVAPRTHAGFRAYFDGFIAGPQAHLTDEARYLGRAVAFEIPMAAHMQPAKRVRTSRKARARFCPAMRSSTMRAIACSVSFHFAARAATRFACERRITPSSITFSPLAESVAPLDVMSTISSAVPAAGAASVAPVLATTR